MISGILGKSVTVKILFTLINQSNGSLSKQALIFKI